MKVQISVLDGMQNRVAECAHHSNDLNWETFVQRHCELWVKQFMTICISVLLLYIRLNLLIIFALNSLCAVCPLFV
jgi:hypothetical protein